MTEQIQIIKMSSRTHISSIICIPKKLYESPGGVLKRQKAGERCHFFFFKFQSSTRFHVLQVSVSIVHQGKIAPKLHLYQEI